MQTETTSFYGLLNIIISDSANCFLIVLISCSKLLLKHSHQSLNFCAIVRFFSFSCTPCLYFLRTRSHSESQEIFNLNVAICREKYTLQLSQRNSGNENLDVFGTERWAFNLLCFWTSKVSCTVWISNTKHSPERGSIHVYTTNLLLKLSYLNQFRDLSN